MHWEPITLQACLTPVLLNMCVPCLLLQYVIAVVRRMQSMVLTTMTGAIILLLLCCDVKTTMYCTVSTAGPDGGVSSSTTLFQVRT
jgi:hypothetical protein